MQRILCMMVVFSTEASDDANDQVPLDESSLLDTVTPMAEVSMTPSDAIAMAGIPPTGNGIAATDDRVAAASNMPVSPSMRSENLPEPTRAGHVLEHGRFVLIEKVGWQFHCPYEVQGWSRNPDAGTCKAKAMGMSSNDDQSAGLVTSSTITGTNYAPQLPGMEGGGSSGGSKELSTVNRGPIFGSVERIFSRRGIRLPYTDALMQVQEVISTKGRLLLDGPREQYLPATKDLGFEGKDWRFDGQQGYKETSSQQKFYDYYFGKRRIGRGSFGECWRALEISHSGEYREVVLKKLFTMKKNKAENTVSSTERDEPETAKGVKDETNGSANGDGGEDTLGEDGETDRSVAEGEEESSKRTGNLPQEDQDDYERKEFVDNRIRQSGEREIFFGIKLRHTPHVARYVDNFSRGNELWLVFVNEGYSLLHLLWWLPPNGMGTPEPSPFWWSLKRPMNHPPALFKRTKSSEDRDGSPRQGLIRYTAQQIRAGSNFVWSALFGEKPPKKVENLLPSGSEGATSAGKAIATYAPAVPGTFPPSRTPIPPSGTPMSPVQKYQTSDDEPTDTSMTGGMANRLPTLTLPSPYSYYNTGLVTVPETPNIDQTGQNHRGLKVVKSLMYQLLRGLAGIHAQNITHRDIKLGNLLVRESRSHDQQKQQTPSQDGASTFRDAASTLANLHLRIADLGSAVFLNAGGAGASSSSGTLGGSAAAGGSATTMSRDAHASDEESDPDSPTTAEEERGFSAFPSRSQPKIGKTKKRLYGDGGPSAEEETFEYMPPEAFFDTVSTFYREASFDIFSAGLCLLEIITGRSIEKVIRIRELEYYLENGSPTEDSILAHSLGRMKTGEQGVGKGVSTKVGVDTMGGFSEFGEKDNGSETASEQQAQDTMFNFRSAEEEDMLSARKELRLEMKYKKLGYTDIEIANAMRAQAFVDTCIRPLSMHSCTDREFQRLLISLDYAQQGFEDLLGRDLLRKLLVWDPKHRITAKEALKHPWFSSEKRRKRRDSDSSKDRNEEASATIGITTTRPKSFESTSPKTETLRTSSDQRLTEDVSQSPPDNSFSKTGAFILKDVDNRGTDGDSGLGTSTSVGSTATLELSISLVDPPGGIEIDHGTTEIDSSEEDERGSSSYPTTHQKHRLPRILTGSYQVKGRRSYMEDAFYVKRKRKFDMLGVYDGHYGAEVARSLRDIFYTKFFKKAIKENTSLLTDEIKHDGQETTKAKQNLHKLNEDGYINHDTKDAMLLASRSAILEFDKHIRATQKTDAGSTMTLVVIQHMTLRIAQVGDCEVHLVKLVPRRNQEETARDDVLTIGQKVEVLATGELGQVQDIRENASASRKLYLIDMQERSGRDGHKKTKFFQRKQLKARVPELSVQALVTPHSPELKAERERILRIPGANVTENNGKMRVQDKLATSRSLGRLPLGLKEFVSSEPDLFLYDLQPGEDSFLIIGSDGLFDTIGSRESAEIVHAVLRGGDREADLQEAARVLVESAIEKGSTDNISVVIAKFLWSEVPQNPEV